MAGFGAVFDAFLDHVERDRKYRFADLDHEAIDDGQCQWQAHRDGGADPFATGDADAAAQRGDVALDDIHADTATGQVGHFSRCRKTGFENQVVNFTIAHFAPGIDQPAFDRLGQNALALEATAVVADGDDDGTGIMAGVQRDATARRLAAGQSH